MLSVQSIAKMGGSFFRRLSSPTLLHGPFWRPLRLLFYFIHFTVSSLSLSTPCPDGVDFCSQSCGIEDG